MPNEANPRMRFIVGSLTQSQAEALHKALTTEYDYAPLVIVNEEPHVTDIPARHSVQMDAAVFDGWNPATANATWLALRSYARGYAACLKSCRTK